MPSSVPREFLEDAIATLTRLRHASDLNTYLRALRRPTLHTPFPSGCDPYSLRLARRVADAVERLSSHFPDKECDNTNGVTELDLLTPRWALLALANEVRRILSPLEASADVATPLGATLRTQTAIIAKKEKEKGGKREWTRSRDTWEVMAHPRHVPADEVMEGLHVLTLPGVQFRLEEAMSQLRRRLEREMPSSANPQRVGALDLTERLLADVEELYAQLVVTVPCTRVFGSAHIAVALLPIIYDLYNRLVDWIVEVESCIDVSVGTHIYSFDSEKYQMMLLRSDLESPWGIQINTQGRLEGLSAAVRVASPLGEEVHRSLRSNKGGAVITAINKKCIPFAQLGSDESNKVFHAYTKKLRRLYLKMEPSPDGMEEMLQELAFFHTSSETTTTGPSLPRATLILQRTGTHVSWNLAINRQLCVVGVPNTILSKEATEFMTAHRGLVHIGAINGVMVKSPLQVESLSSVIQTLVLELRVECRGPSWANSPITATTTSSSSNNNNNHIAMRVENQTNNHMESDDAMLTSDKDQSEIAERENKVNRVEDTSRFTETGTPMESVPHTLGAELKDKMRNSPLPNDLASNPTSSDLHKSVENSASPIDPLCLVNGVTIELLTEKEMVLCRNSAERRWGLELQTIEKDPMGSIYVIGIPPPPDVRRLEHPYYKLFKSRVGKWRVGSVNGSVATRVPDIVDIMKSALRMRIKFRGR